MKNIRHVYRFNFVNNGMKTCIEIKAETLKDLYFKILFFEPALQRLDDRAARCIIETEHKRRKIKILSRMYNRRSFLPCQVIPEKDYNRILNVR